MGIMHIVWMLIVGLVVGAVARFIMPGAQHMSWLMTSLLGIAGSFVGGFVSHLIWKPADGRMLHPAGFVFSVLGAMALLFVLHHLHVGSF